MFRIQYSLLLACGFTCLSIASLHTPTNTHELLSKIGLTRVRGPQSHHRKRLAVQSRHHSRSDDSHMFIIKLPPNPHYYKYNNHVNSLEEPSKKQNIPIGFKNNGKPAKVYHWNLPVLKSMVTHKLKSRKNDDIHNIPINDFPNPEKWNEVIEKPDDHIIVKPKKPFYYVPVKPQKSSFKKYFPGNGKPHSFYVIEKSKKSHYHRLLP